jgi:multidrug efflux pump subunit AcrB
MRSFFNLLTQVALRFRGVTLAIVALIMSLGVIAAGELKQELLPPIEFPQTIILAQVSGMTSDQVLNIVTERIENSLLEIPEIVNVESQTSGTFGVVITVSNDFGLDQDALREDIRAAIDDLWFPLRVIQPDEGESAQEFVERLLGELPPDVMLYLARRDPNFLFQLSPDVWAQLSDETIRVLTAYLAQQTNAANDEKSALESLVEQEVLPQLETIDLVANIQVSGGQLLPDEQVPAFSVAADGQEPTSLLLQLTPETWRIISERLDGVDAQDEGSVEVLQAVELPQFDGVPSLPESWRMDHFSDASDLVEMRSLTRTLAGVLNDFYTNGEIVGSLGQTDDLTSETVVRMLELDPTMAEYFEADQLVAMTPEVFDALPDDLRLDGFTRDELAAASLARSVTGTTVEPDPVNLPSAWRIQPPQLITFSFADIPLATFSVFSTAAPNSASEITESEAGADTEGAGAEAETEASPELTQPESISVPEGPALPQLYSLFGDFLDVQLDSADDLITLQLPQDFAQFAGATNGAGLLNLLAQLDTLLAQAGDTTALPEGTNTGLPDFSDPTALTQFLPALQECGIGLLDLNSPNFSFSEALIGCLNADVMSFVVANDPNFVDQLQPVVFQYFALEVLEVEGISPRLGDTWDTLAGRPEFADMPLRTADDLLALGNGSAASVLNTINAEVPERYAGYEVRLFDSLTPRLLNYFALEEDGFYSNLDSDVLLKFSPEALAAIPDAVISSLPVEIAEQISAIAGGESASAAEQVADDYASDVPPARPDAPALNSDWQTIAGFLSIQLNNAYDLFRFPDVTGTPAQFFNGLFSSPGGASFAPNLLGNLPRDAFFYIADEDPDFIANLGPQALNLLSEEIYNELPQSARDRAEAGEVFVPTAAVTRTNGAPSLLITVYKDGDVNTVEAYRAVESLINEIDAANDNIAVEVAFEQASFIEESISSVVSSGVLGAIFAIVNILIFLSGGIWGKQGRRIAGAIVLVLSALFIGLLFVMNGNSIEALFNEAILLTIMGIVGLVAGIGILIWPWTLPYPSWRPTLVIAVSIPLSILSALALMNWLPPFVNTLLQPYSDSAIVSFLLRLFPENLTLNIMTLSGLTVAVGRLVDDSIVVLENIFRQMQSGMEKREAVLYATRDVSVAIFSATSIAVVVFLPLGLTGGITAEFFLPFGLAVTYTLLSSFLTAITVVPALAYMILTVESIPEETETWMQRIYVPGLKWLLKTSPRRIAVVLLAVLSAGFGFFLFSQRPAAFLPDFGEPQISISVTLPQGTGIIETNERVEEMENAVREIVPEDQLVTIRTIVGGGGLNFEALFGGGGVSENVADITLRIAGSEGLDTYTDDLRASAVEIFGEEYVTVSLGSLTSQGFGGFEVVVSGADQETLAAYNDEVVAALESFDELSNVSSNLADDNADGPPTFIRVDGEPALSYTGDLDTDDTINFATEAIEYLEAEIDFPDGVEIGQGFDTELQTQGFADIFVAMGIALAIVVLILVLVFQSPVYWFAVIFSVIVAPVGAAVALTLTDRVLGISALIGLLMLLGLVVTNAIVLIDRVGSNRKERGMDLYDALVEAGGRRIRPILMTALTTIIGLLPLAWGISEGAIIAAELGTVVIGGIVSSTLLTLIVVPAAYYLFTPAHDAFNRLFTGSDAGAAAAQDSSKQK